MLSDVILVLVMIYLLLICCLIVVYYQCCVCDQCCCVGCKKDDCVYDIFDFIDMIEFDFFFDLGVVFGLIKGLFG